MANSSSWMPPPGRHNVNIGSSLGRAIKTRKMKGSPAPQAKRSNLPERDFYSFKFNFKASSIDGSKPASMETVNGPDNTQVRADYPSTQSGEIHKFIGTEQSAKDIDCILIYDEDTGQYTLEKLDSFIQLKFERKEKAPVSPQPASPAPVAASKGKAKQEDIGLDLGVQNVKAEYDVADLDEIMKQAVALSREEEEEEEGEEVEPPRRAPSPPKPPSPVPPPKAARPMKSMPKLRAKSPPKAQPPPVAVAPPPVPKVKPAPAKSKKTKAAPPVSYPDEEVIEFGKPAKRARPSPPPPRPPPPPARAASPVSLSLPGGSTPAFAPPPVPPITKPALSRNVPPHVPPPQLAMPPSPQMAQLDSDDDEEDWEQVPTAAPVIPQADYEAELEEDIFGDGFAEDADGGEDIDVNDFEQMMNEQMERDSDDDFLAAAVSPEPERPTTRQPISLNRLASGGGAADSDEEDFSSSDESDED